MLLAVVRVVEASWRTCATFKYIDGRRIVSQILKMKSFGAILFDFPILSSGNCGRKRLCLRDREHVGLILR